MFPNVLSHMQVPSYCIEYQQQILYSYSVYDVNQEKLLKQFGPLKEPRLIINGLLEEVGYYRVIVNYWDANLPFQNVTVEKHFCEFISCCCPLLNF